MESTFRKDVMADIAWEKENIAKQIELLEPMSKELHRSSGMRFLSKTGYFFTEIIVWVLILIDLAWLAFLFRVPPFFNWSRVKTAAQHSTEIQISQQEFDLIDWALRGLVILIAILLFIIVRQLAKLRNKASISQMAGKTIRDMKMKLEERKIQLQNFEDKYQYLLVNDAYIEPDGFNNPLPPPEGDEYL